MLKERLSKNNITKILLQISLVFGLFALVLLLPKPANAAWMEAGGVQCHDCIYQVDGHTVDTNHVEVWLYAVDDAIPGATIYDKRITNAFVAIGGVNANECGQSVQGLGYNQSNSGRVGLRESCYHKMTLTASAPGYDSITYDVNVAPNDCNLLNHNGDVVDYYAHLIRNTPPPAGGINVTYTCLSDNTHVKADISWNADSSQRKLWVDKGNNGTPVPPEITENSNPGTSITSSTNSYSFGSSFGLLENTSNNFAVLTGGNQLVAQNRNNRALNCGTTTPGDDEPGGNPPGSGTGRLHIRVFNDTKDIGLFHNNDGTYDPILLESEAPNTKVRLNSRNGNFMPRDSTTLLEYEEELSPGNYRVYFLSDPGWTITKYSTRVDSIGDYNIYDYTDYSSTDNYFYTTTVSVVSSEHSYINLGVTRGAQPDLIAHDAQFGGVATSFEKPTAPVTVSGIVENSGQFLQDSYNVSAAFYIDKNIPSPNPLSLSGYTTAATTTGTVSTGSTQSFVTAEIPASAFSTGSHTLQLCADYPNNIVESNDTNNCTSPLPFSVSDPPDQWLKTTLGDVGVKGAINMAFHPTGQNNADYLVLAEKTISATFFTSAKYWLIQKYPNTTPPSISIYPDSAKTFGGLVGEYTKNHAVRTLATVDLSTIGSSPEDIVQSTGDVNALSGNYSGGRKVVFINGNLKITNDITLAAPTNEKGLIFIVSGNTTIAAAAQNVNAILITYGKFSTTDDYTGCGPKPMTSGFHNQLKINGAVYSFGQACFTRNIGKTLSPTTPAELITYEPKYLVLFKDLLGETVTSFKETTP